MQCFLDPLKWEQPYIPILPEGEEMEGNLMSPFPMIIGILRTHLDKICDNAEEIKNSIDILISINLDI